MQKERSFDVLGRCLLGQGYSPVPLQSDRSPFKRWPDLCTEPLTPSAVDSLSSRFPRLGIGVAGGYNGLVPIDFDTDDKEIIARARDVLPTSGVLKRGSKGFTAFYRCREPVRAFKLIPPPPDCKPLIEVLTTGVITIPPTMHPKTGQPYRWLRGSLYEIPIYDLGIITPDHLKRLREVMEPYCPNREIIIEPGLQSCTSNNFRMAKYARTAVDQEKSRLLVIRSGRNVALFKAASKLGKFVHHGFIGETDVLHALLEASNGNGYIKKRGRHSAIVTIKSGIAKASNDELPDLYK